MAIEEARVDAIIRYPVKGLAGQPLVEVELEAGATLPLDRVYAIENGAGRFDPLEPKFLPKINFLMLMRNERLASLEVDFDAASHTLTIMRNGKQVARGELSQPVGRKMIEQFLGAYMSDELRGAPKVVHAAGHSFSDVSSKCLHIVNLSSVRELSRLADREIDPRRFRPNLVLDGLEARTELEWLDRELVIGDSRLKVFAKTDRCAATDVDPETGERDMAIPQLLERRFGHVDFGVYARVVSPGTIRRGDNVGIVR